MLIALSSRKSGLPEWTFMTTRITKSTLDNGLTVILKEMHHAPVTCFMVWYRVGSRHEVPGIT
jgi:zinc protease